MKSVAHLFPKILEHCKVLLYQGQFDFRDGVEGNIPWMREIPWKGNSDFVNDVHKTQNFVQMLLDSSQKYSNRYRQNMVCSCALEVIDMSYLPPGFTGDLNMLFNRALLAL